MKELQLSLRILLLSLVVACASTLGTKAQVSFGGQPASFNVTGSENLKALKDQIIPLSFAKLNFNPEDLKAQNNWTEGEMATKPLIIGGIIPVDIDFAKEAIREELPSGQKIYRLRVATHSGARAINLYYKDFFIPQDGGELFIYTPDKKNVLGAYNYNTHSNHGAFATEILPGSEVILEYVLPQSSKEILPSIHIDGVNYIFNSHIAQAFSQEEQNTTKREVQDSEDQVDRHECVINVNCPEGDAWNAEKASVVQLFLVTKQYSGSCTGSLLNNTNEDFTPLILTAGHCVGNEPPLPTDAVWDKFMFSFHFAKPSCSNASYSEAKRIKTMVGCKPLAYSSVNKRSDGLLLQITQDIPLSYRVYYSGWDSSADMPKGLLGMHHPAADVMKLSYLNPPRIVNLGQWNDGSSLGCKNCHFAFTFNEGDTYGGSSGSPIWNQDHRIVGTLTGGAQVAGCHGSNLYGRLNAHWDRFASEKDLDDNVKPAMQTFLDPKDGGKIRKLDGRWREDARTVEPIKAVVVSADFTKKTIHVQWKDIDRSAYPSHWKLSYLIYRNGKQIDGVEFPAGTTSYSEPFDQALSDTNVKGGVSYGIVARYSFEGKPLMGPKGKETFTESTMVSNGIVLAPLVTHVKPNLKEDQNGVAITYKAPGNLQELSNFGYPEKEGEKLAVAQLPLPSFYYNVRGMFGTTRHYPDRGAIGSRFYVDGFIEPSIDIKDDRKQTNYYYVNSVKVIPGGKLEKGEKYNILVTSKDKGPKGVSELFDLPTGWQPGDWVEVFLKRPFRFDPRQSLVVALSMPNKQGKDAAGVAVVKTKEPIDLPISRTAIVLSDDNALLHIPYQYISRRPVEGYPAIRPVISSSSMPINTNEALGDVEGKIVAYSTKAIPTPKILGYKIYCNGELITKGQNGKDYYIGLYYYHKGGKATDKYEVEVVYAEPEQLATEDVAFSSSVRLYPTKLMEDGKVNLVNSQLVDRMLVYTMEGQLVKEIEKPASSVSLSELPQGVYFVVLHTEEGEITARIVK